MTDLNEIPKAKKNYPHCLRFVLKGVWYDKIKSGQKRIEYREVKPYWDKRIRNLYHFNNTPDFNKCIFTRGYTNEMLIAEIERIEIIFAATKKEALRAFEQLNGARVIEKNMRTGTEKIIKERVPA